MERDISLTVGGDMMEGEGEGLFCRCELIIRFIAPASRRSDPVLWKTKSANRARPTDTVYPILHNGVYRFRL